MKIKYWFLLICIVTIILQKFLMDYAGEYAGIGPLLGASFAYILVPFVITLVAKGVFKLFKSDLEARSLHITFLVVWILSLLSNTSGTIDRKRIAPLNHNIHSESSAQFQRFNFPSASSNIFVQFQSSPTLTNNHITIGNSRLTTESAELVVASDLTYLRAELIKLSPKEVVESGFDNVVANLEKYAYLNGIQNPEIKSGSSNNFDYYELRGFKELEDDRGITRPITYVVRYYHHNGEHLFLYTACISDKFPSKQIIMLWNSVQLRE